MCCVKDEGLANAFSSRRVCLPDLAEKEKHQPNGNRSRGDVKEVILYWKKLLFFYPFDFNHRGPSPTPGTFRRFSPPLPWSKKP